MKFRPGARVLRIRLGLVVTALSAASCAPAPDLAAHSIEDYATDPALRHETLARCTNDPGTLKKAPDCVNVIEAERRVGIGSLRELTPLNTPAKP